MTAGPTGRTRRWWEGGERSIEAEERWFKEAGLDFRLDQELFELHEVVVFRGELRLGKQTAAASVHYPPAYNADGLPVVVASDLRLGRHQAPNGQLCLDHPVFGESLPMYGAEAVTRAERLWYLWENNRDQLAREEAVAPDPRANYYPFEHDSAVVLIDVDVVGFSAGYVRLAALDLKPFRAGVTQIKTAKPTATSMDAPPGIAPFSGSREIHGPWIRLDEPPPIREAEFTAWVKEHQGEWIDRHLRAATAVRAKLNQPDLPTVFGFVYPDEGPGRGEIHDAWHFLVIHPNGRGQLARTFHLRSDERWLRQPQLAPLADKRVTIVGVGALGSQIADLLAKAGVGTVLLVDHDVSAIGNRVRHQLDLADLGRLKTHAMANRALRVNPWAEVEVQALRVGGAALGPSEKELQEAHDTLLADVQSSDLLINAAANSVAGRYCSRLACEAVTPALHAWVTAGAWGGRALLQRPRENGCWECLAHTQKDCGEAVPPIPSDPDISEVMERGCADPTFTGPGFELASTATAATRFAVQSLLDGAGYPGADFDLVSLCFRDETTAMPGSEYTRLPVHPACTVCND